MSQSETFLLIVLGFAVASFLGLIIGRLAWKLALRLGAKRAMRNMPSTVTELQTDRDRLRADHAMMAKKLSLRVDDMKMRIAEQSAEVTRHRNRVENLTQEVSRRDNEILRLKETVSRLESETVANADIQKSLQLKLSAKIIHDSKKSEELPLTVLPVDEQQSQDRLQTRINELTSLSDQISKQRDDVAGEAPQLTNGILVKPADSTAFQPEVLETKIIEAEQAANQLQVELKRLEEAWPDNAVIVPAEPEKTKTRRGITNVISLAQRIKALQKTITN